MNCELFCFGILLIVLGISYRRYLPDVCSVNHFEVLCKKVDELDKELEELKGYIVNIQYKMNSIARPVVVCRNPDENDGIQNNKIGCFWINKVTGEVWKFCENRNGPLDSSPVWVKMEEGLF